MKIKWTRGNNSLKSIGSTVSTLLWFLFLAVAATAQGQFTYTTNTDNTLTITGYTGSGGAVTIPTNINGLTVRSIGYYAFSETAVTSVTIPGSLSIEDYAFDDSEFLTNATIQYGVAGISDFAFAGCSNLSSVAIPRSVNSVGYGAFVFCESLVNVTLPGSVTNVGDYAFFGCSSLTNVTIAKGVSSIAYAMFDYCGNLTGVFFQGNAPTVTGNSGDGPVFYGNNNVTVYYLPGTTGWSNIFQGVPAVLWNAQIQYGTASYGLRYNQFGFNIIGTAGIPIVVEACTNLASPIWTPRLNLTLITGSFYFSEPQGTNYSIRYYRISFP
jgi:hypothetical protein